jgi:serine/threonine protein kinase
VAQSGATDRKKEAITRVISEIISQEASSDPIDESKIIAAHPELMPELQTALRRLHSMTSMPSETSTPIGATAVPPVGQSTIEDTGEPEGTKIEGYALERELGRGGQAVVYLAVQKNTGRKVALKLMRREAIADERALARFKREVQVLAALDHPNIVGVMDTGSAGAGAQFIVMNYVAGTSLDEYLKPRWGERTELLRLFLKICDAVNFAHVRGIVHRDLKPGNIRIDERGEPHILDFGLAHTPLDRLAGGFAVSGEFLGSLPWSSPEQAARDPDRIDMRTDVYSLGVILYQMLSGGKFPYDVKGDIRVALDNITNAAPAPLAGVDGRLEGVVRKALSKNKEQRYQTAGELGREVSNYLAERDKKQHGGRRKSVVLIVAGLIAGLILAEHARHSRLPRVVSESVAPARTIFPATQPAVATPTAAEIAVPVAEAPQAPVEFGSGRARGWPIVVAMGTCHLDGDELALTPGPLQCVMYLGYPNWSAYDFSFQMKTNATSDNRGVRVMVNQTRGNACVLWLGRNDNSEMELSSHQEALPARLSAVASRLEPDRWYEVKVQVRGDEIHSFLDGKPMLQGSEKRLTHGRAGLAVFDSSVRFRDIVVKSPDGAVLWQGPPDVTRLPANEVDRPNSVPPVDMKMTDVLAHVDLMGDALAGQWTESGDAIRGQGDGAQIQFPTQPPAEYDYRITFVRYSGNGGVGLICSQRGKSFVWIFGGHNGTASGLGQVQGEPFDNNETTRHSMNWLPNGLVHTLVVRVRKDWAIAFLDGQNLGRANGLLMPLSLPSYVKTPSAASPLGIWLESDAVIVKSADVFALSPRATTEPGER